MTVSRPICDIVKSVLCMMSKKRIYLVDSVKGDLGPVIHAVVERHNGLGRS